MSKERLAWIDAVKGIAIIGVVIAHIGLFYDLVPPWLPPHNAIPLPAFIFVSGYLFNWDRYKTQAGFFIKKRALQLILPVYAIGVFALIFQYLYWFFTGQVLARAFWAENPFTVLVRMLQVDLSYYSWFHSVWFLSALFVCEIVFFCILLLVKSDIHRILAAILLAIAALFFFYNTYEPFFFAPALASLVFYVAGYMARKYDAIKRMNSKVLIVVGCTYALLCSYPDVIIGFAELKYSNPLIFYIGTLAGSVFLSKILYILYAHNIISKSLEYMGRNSLLIMLVNIPVIFSLQRLIDMSHLPIYPSGVLFTLAMIIFVGMIHIKNISVKKMRAGRLLLFRYNQKSPLP